MKRRDWQLRQRALVTALLASMLLWNLPFGGFVLYPFKLFETWLHEMAHGVTMLVAGAGFDHLELFRDTSGVAIGSRGVGPTARAFIASAGYVGTAAFGAAFLILGQSQRAARSILGALAAALAISAIVWCKGTFSVAAVLGLAAGLAILAALASETMAIFIVNFVAAQACANAILDIRVLFRTELTVGGATIASDAQTMSSMAFGSPSLWASVWLTWSFALFFVAPRIIYLRDRRRSTADETGVSEGRGGSD